MALFPDPVDGMIENAARGDRHAREGLLAHHRDRLRRMVQFRLDRRLTARVDPSDVVQDTLIDAERKLDDYLGNRPIPFYPWLRRLASEQLVRLQRFHLGAECRNATLEIPNNPALNDDSFAKLAENLIDTGTAPSARLAREEDVRRVRTAMSQLKEQDREVLALRYLEQASFAEVAAILDVSEGTAKVRHFRALERIRTLLETGSEGA